MHNYNITCNFETCNSFACIYKFLVTRTLHVHFRRIINIDGKTEYSWCQAHALYLDQLGVVYYESLQPNETIITRERYQQQLMQLSRELKQKR